jgi:hypothetical protein
MPCDDKQCFQSITDEHLEKIVDMTIKKMTEKAYQEVGKKVLGGFGWFVTMVGLVTFSLYSILKAKGIIN